MSSEKSAFNHRQDEELGGWLRSVLTPENEPGFIARVMQQVPATILRETGWDILGQWARTGLAAAAVLMLLAGYMLGTIAREPAEEPATLASARVFDPDTLLNSPDV